MHHDVCPGNRVAHGRLIEHRPPRIAMALLLAAAGLHLVLPTESIFLFSSNGLAAVVVLTGFAVMTAAWWQFKVRNVAIRPTAASTHLITDGVYRLSRNPMYLGIITMLAGIATYFGTLPFFAAALIYFVLIDRWFCRYEEEKLLATFGEAFEQYRSRVRRWI